MVYRASRIVHSFDGRRVLDLQDFHVPQGSRFALIGPNGSGKTTLSEILVGLLSPEAADLTFCGQPAPVPFTAAQRSRLAYVAQQPFPLPGRVLGNVVLAIGGNDSRGEKERRALDCLNELGIGRLAGQTERTLSVGQLRLVSLSRALARGADIWVLDEPFAFGDESFKRSLDVAIAKHNRAGGTIVMTSCRGTSVSKWADEALELPPGNQRGTV